MFVRLVHIASFLLVFTGYGSVSAASSARGVSGATSKRIFAIGTACDSPYTQVETYSLATGNWTPTTSLPWGRDGNAAASANGKVYTIGGLDMTLREASAATEVFVFNKWTSVPTIHLAMPRFEHSACTLHGQIYVTGGFNDSQYPGPAAQTL